MGAGLEGIGGAIGGLIGQATAGKGGQGKLKQISRLWKDLQRPDFDYRDLTAPELQMVAEFFPDTYDAVVPAEVRLAQEGPEGRQAQLSSLYGLQQIGQEGLPLADRLAAQESQFRLSDTLGRNDAAIKQNLVARGRAGGGNEVALRAAGGQTGANLAASLGRDLVRQGLERRMGALQGAGQLGGQLRAQDQALSGENARAVNRFNELTAQIRNQAAMDAADARTKAQAYNVGTQQDLANQNTLNRYGVGLENLNRKNSLKQQSFGNDVTRLQGYTGALGQEAAYKEAKRAERIRMGQQVGGAIGAVGDQAVDALSGGLTGGLGGGGGGGLLGGLFGGGGKKSMYF